MRIEMELAFTRLSSNWKVDTYVGHGHGCVGGHNHSQNDDWDVDSQHVRGKTGHKQHKPDIESCRNLGCIERSEKWNESVVANVSKPHTQIERRRNVCYECIRPLPFTLWTNLIIDTWTIFIALCGHYYLNRYSCVEFAQEIAENRRENGFSITKVLHTLHLATQICGILIYSMIFTKPHQLSPAHSSHASQTLNMLMNRRTDSGCVASKMKCQPMCVQSLVKLWSNWNWNERNDKYVRINHSHPKCANQIDHFLVDASSLN